MKKYFTLFSLSIQKQLDIRSEFFFERVRSLSVLFSLYFLWSAVLKGQKSVFGYEREQLLTYVVVMTLLRAWVLACVTDQIPGEISKGKISDVLLRPISHMYYWAMQDAANKVISVVSAVVEISIFVTLVSAPLYISKDALSWLLFFLSTLAGMVIYFQMSYMLGVVGFWSSATWGPRFCFEVILEFCAGAYFPIDVLPLWAQKILSYLPFPYLVFTPISIYLGRLSSSEIMSAFLHQFVWIGVLAVATRLLWRAGLSHYSAEGA